MDFLTFIANQDVLFWVFMFLAIVVAYLLSLLRVILVDDNPMSKHLGEVIPHHEEILIYDEEHKLPAYVNQTRYQSPKQFSRLIMDRLERLL